MKTRPKPHKRPGHPSAANARPFPGVQPAAPPPPAGAGRTVAGVVRLPVKPMRPYRDFGINE